MSDKLKNRNFGFSGYIDVDGAEKDSKHMHYWFFPSESGQDTILWSFGLMVALAVRGYLVQ